MIANPTHRSLLLVGAYAHVLLLSTFLAGCDALPNDRLQEVLAQIRLSPLEVVVAPGETVQFTAEVLNEEEARIAWRVLEGTQGGIITINGKYQAPTNEGSYTVVASALSDPTLQAQAVVTVSSAVVSPSWNGIFAMVSSTPASPSNENDLVLHGTGEPGAAIFIYPNGQCSGPPIGESCPDSSGEFNVNVTVADNSSNVFFANGQSLTGEVFPCTRTWVGYIEDSSAPAAPVISSLSPASPSSINTVAVTVQAEPLSTVRLYSNSTCDSVVLAQAQVPDSGQTILSLTVEDNTSTLLHVASTDQAGNVSYCSPTPVSYVENSGFPLVSLVTPANGATIPAGQMSAVPVAGTCSEVGRVVTAVVSTVTASWPCVGGAFSGTLDLSNLSADASGISLLVSHDNASGQTASISHLIYITDSTPPAAPSSLAVTPVGPANNNLPTVSGNAEAGATVRVYGTADCSGSVLASAVSNGSGVFSVQVAVSNDTTTVFRATATDAGGNTSACSTSSVSYTENSTTPIAPYVASVSPTGPANNNNPLVSGFMNPNANVRIYGNSNCSGASLASGLSDGVGDFSVSVTINNNQSYTFFAAEVDAGGAVSACSTTFVSYVEDSTAPTAPTLSSLGASGSNPTVTGTAEANASVKLYTTSNCSGSPVGTGSANGSEAFTLTASIPANTKVTFYGTATDAAGNVSPCASSSLSTAVVTISGTLSMPVACAPATGGSVTYRNGYYVHTFVSNGALSSSCARTAQVLVVAGGGGGGGATGGGGGGGGGVLYNASFSLSAGASYAVTVGSGGAGASAYLADGASGGNSVFGSMTAIGGGRGASGAGGTLDPSIGGSGGGGDGQRNNSGAAGTALQGFAGGNGLSGAGGGGGGAGAAGTNATAGNAPGKGGDGFASPITGVTAYYGGGGGGGAANTTTALTGKGLGGLGGGGRGNLGVGDPGAPNTGGGGGGGAWDGTFGAGGEGGSGVVLVRYAAQAPGGSGATVRVRVNGVSVGTATVDANGTYSLTAPMTLNAGDVVTAYLDNSAYLAASYTKLADGYSNVTNLNLTAQAITLSHLNAGPFTNADVNLADATQDADIGIASDGTNVVLSSGWMLIVDAFSTYAPGGTVSTAPSSNAASKAGDLEIRFGATLQAQSHALSIGGDFMNAGTFTYNTGQTVTFTAVSQGHFIEDGASSFYNIVFAGNGGGGWGMGATTLVEGVVTQDDGIVFTNGL